MVVYHAILCAACIVANIGSDDRQHSVFILTAQTQKGMCFYSIITAVRHRPAVGILSSIAANGITTLCEIVNHAVDQKTLHDTWLYSAHAEPRVSLQVHHWLMGVIVWEGEYLGQGCETQVECAGEESANSNPVFPSPGVLFRGGFRRKRMDSVTNRGVEGGGDSKTGAGSLN